MISWRLLASAYSPQNIWDILGTPTLAKGQLSLWNPVPKDAIENGIFHMKSLLLLFIRKEVGNGVKPRKKPPYSNPDFRQKPLYIVFFLKNFTIFC
jgi:hypothetical protein